MEEDSGIEIQLLRADGGAVANTFLMQFQSDILGKDVELARLNETTALGAAYLAGLATGFWQDLSEIEELSSTQKVYRSSMTESDREILYKGWKKAVAATRYFSREE